MSLLLPSFSSNAVDLLLELLQTGMATAPSLRCLFLFVCLFVCLLVGLITCQIRDLETAVEVAESLNIHLDNLDFSGMYPEVKEDTLDFSRMKLEVKEDNPTLTEINLEVDPEVRKKLEIYPGVKEEETELQNCTSETFKDIATSEASAGIHTDEGMIEHTKIESKTNELQVENNSVTETKIAETNRPASEASVSAGPQYPTQEDLDQAKANILKDILRQRRVFSPEC